MAYIFLGMMGIFFSGKNWGLLCEEPVYPISKKARIAPGFLSFT